MKKLFDSIVKGLQKEGYTLEGGGDLYAVLSKDGDIIKIFTAHGYNHFIVRYSVRKGDSK